MRHRLYKVMWTQPLPLLCLAETESSRCGLVFASCRKLNREVCQRQREERLMEHLTQRRSQFELSHILVTQLEAWHHGCWANTVNTFTWHSSKTAPQQKCILKTLLKKVHVFVILCPLYYAGPPFSTKTHHTHR